MAFDHLPASRGSRAATAFLVFVAVPTAIITLVLAVCLCLGLVWTDLLHDNPYRTTANVVAMMALSPFYGLAGAIFLGGIPVLAGAALASTAVLVSGQLSLKATTLIIFVCAALFVCGCYVGADALAEESDWQATSPPWSTLIFGPFILAGSWYGGRWTFLRLFA